MKKNFRDLFDQFVQTSVFKEQIPKHKGLLRHEMSLVDSKVEHPNV